MMKSIPGLVLAAQLMAWTMSQAATNNVEVNFPLLGFALVDQDNQPVELEHLRGKTWVANFIFTRCTATCPAQTAQLTALQMELEKHPRRQNISFVSITVDPTHDTPAVLKEYARNAGADLAHWKFLTGRQEDIFHLSRDGFKLPVFDAAANGLITHSSRFVLVDQFGHVRGYYEFNSEDEMKRLRADLDRVFSEQFNIPPDVQHPSWLETVRQSELDAAKGAKVFHDFQFTDRRKESGITFRNRSTDDSSRAYVANHYDHGNGLAIADVDGDGLPDIYFVNQAGENELWRNKGDGTFENITVRAGVGVPGRINMTASFADIDNDGRPDLYVTTVRGGNVLFHNNGGGKFTDISKESGLDYNGHSSAAVFFDYNRDGLLDVFLCNVGKYTTDEQLPAFPGASLKYFVGMKEAFSGHLKPEFSEQSILFENTGHNRFIDVSEKRKLKDMSWSGDATPLDVNEDGWPDLYVLNMQGHDHYYENVHGEYFVDKTAEVFSKTPWGAMGVKSFDYDNDGKMDLYITDMHSDMSKKIGPEDEKAKSQVTFPETYLRSEGKSIYGNAFYRKLGTNHYEEVSDKLNLENYWPWGVSVGDLNADGYQDVFVTCSMSYPFRYAVNKLLLNQAGGPFLDAEFTLAVEPRRWGQVAQPVFDVDCTGRDRDLSFCRVNPGKGKGVVWGALGSRSSAMVDLDNDGDLDLVTNDFGSQNVGAEPMILISNLAQKRNIHYIKIRLQGGKSNCDGLGARVTVHAGAITGTQIHDGKSGYVSQSSSPLYFGLGDTEQIDQIEVVWPSGRKSLLKNSIQSNTTLKITEP